MEYDYVIAGRNKDENLLLTLYQGSRLMGSKDEKFILSFIPVAATSPAVR